MEGQEESGTSTGAEKKEQSGESCDYRERFVFDIFSCTSILFRHAFCALYCLVLTDRPGGVVVKLEMSTALGQ